MEKERYYIKNNKIMRKKIIYFKKYKIINFSFINYIFFFNFIIFIYFFIHIPKKIKLLIINQIL